MEKMINEMLEKFRGNLQEFFMWKKHTLAEAEQYFGKCLSDKVRESYVPQTSQQEERTVT